VDCEEVFEVFEAEAIAEKIFFLIKCTPTFGKD